jgi:hypothetical protein
MTDLHARIAANLADVRGRMAEAARRAGRSAETVSLVAVTKYVGPAAIEALLAAGCRDLGESRPQQLWQRATLWPEAGIRWHLIGHLQRNKVRRTLPLVAVVQSVDSHRLAEAIHEEATALQRRAKVLLEVNTSGETAKHGFAPDELASLLPRLAAMDALSIGGLMCMARLDGDLDDARRDFAALRELRDRLRRDAPPGTTLDALSMGMSGDFEVAIEEGATLVRVGSALFEGIDA